MTTTVSTKKVAEAFNGVKKLLHATCHDFRRKYGGNHEDLFSQSQEIFLAAHDQFDPNKGMKFSTYIRQAVWWRLLDQLRHDQHRLNQLPRQEFDGDTIKAEEEKNFDLDDFCIITGLSEAAKTIVHLTTSRSEVPGEVHRGKAALKKILADELGWIPYRIRKAFREVTKALKEAQ